MTDAQPINSYKEKTMNKKNILIETEEPKPEIQIEVYEMDCSSFDGPPCCICHAMGRCR
jgi:hypothetical protein